MKLMTWLTSLSAIFIFNFLNASNHNLSFGMEALQYKISDHVDRVKVEGDQFFWGVRFQYEYKPPKGVYFGMDTSSSIIRNDKSFKFTLPNQTSIKLINGLSFHGTEFRLGYTFDQCFYSISPFFALGAYRFDRTGQTSLRYDALDLYYGSGFIINYALNRHLDIKFIVKALIIDHEADIRYKGHYFRKKSNECGLEIALPCTFHLYKQFLNFKVEPYFLTLSTRNKNFVYGSSFLLELAF